MPDPDTDTRPPAGRTAPRHGAGRRSVLLGLAAGALALRPAAGATTLPAPQGDVLLTVTGDVGTSNAPDGAQFDDAMLAALPQVAFTTGTLWTPAPRRFEGPALSAVLAAAGAADPQPQRIEASAANDYRTLIDPALVGPRAPIVARRIDGAPFGLRDRGPLWVMFPFDDDPAFRTEPIYAQSVWQLVALAVTARR